MAETKKRVLIADDSFIDREILHHILEDHFEITDAKNGIFIVADEEGNSILVRLPKNAEGVSYASWTDLKVVVGDTVQLYGKPAKNSSSPTTEKAKIEAAAELGEDTEEEAENKMFNYDVEVVPVSAADYEEFNEF